MKHTQKKLLSLLLPYDIAGMTKVRLGQQADGGYIVSKEALSNITACLSYGIAGDISFEKDLRKWLPNAPIYLFDPSVEGLPEPLTNSVFAQEGTGMPFTMQQKKPSFLSSLIKTAGKCILRPLKKIMFSKQLRTMITKNLPGPVRNAVWSVSSDPVVLPIEDPLHDPRSWKLQSIDEHIDEYQLRDKALLLKMDIESSEYLAIDALSPRALGIINILIIELHYTFDRGYVTAALRIIKKLSKHMTLFHIHGNNNGGFISINPNLSSPDLLELTFVNNALVTSKKISSEEYPTALDKPCMPDKPEVPLPFISYLRALKTQKQKA